MAAILITGRPGSGKTTLVRAIVEVLDCPAGGFYTRETRGQDGRRTGFEIVTLAGEAAPLARTGIAGPHRVGRYGVDIDALDRVGVPAIEAAVERGVLIVVDEIGKMELLSLRFQRALIECFRHHRLLFGTIMQTSHPFANELKAQPDTLLIELAESNRDEVRALAQAQLLAALGRLSV